MGREDYYVPASRRYPAPFVGWDSWFRSWFVVDESLNATSVDLDALSLAYGHDRDGA